MNHQQPANIELTNHKHIQCTGDWTTLCVTNLELKIEKLKMPKVAEVVIDGQNLKVMDSAGAWFLQKLIFKLQKKNIKVQLDSFKEEQLSLLDLISKDAERIFKKPLLKPKRWVNPLYIIGKVAVEKYLQFLDFMEFLGEFIVTFIKNVLMPNRFQWKAFLITIDETGFRALPIVGLLSFLVGVVLSYQMGQQLKFYGANIYIVSLLGLAILQEFAPLITAIIGAGRTSSAFTAQIGAMKIHEEIDALRTMGVSPFDRLVVPKVMGLIVTMPLLTLWAGAFGTLGGMIMAKAQLGITYYGFVHQFPKVVKLSTFLNGIVKAPIFALIISLVGCFQGFQVKYSADSVGSQTTKSVVQAIFFIIIADSIFSVIMSWQTIL